MTYDFSWQGKARCLGLGNTRFFPEQRLSIAPRSLKRFCEKCPVISECLNFALETDQAGIWGGKTDTERRNLKQEELDRKAEALVQSVLRTRIYRLSKAEHDLFDELERERIGTLSEVELDQGLGVA